MNYNKAYENKLDVKPEEKVEEVVEEPIIGVVCDAEQVYMRESADVNSEEVAIIDKDTELEILDDSDADFYKVCNSSGITGYMMKKFVKII